MTVLRLNIKVVPSASRRGIVRHGNGFKAYVKAAPERGAANAELVGLVADKYGVKKKAVSISRGLRSMNKTLEVRGI